MVTALDQPSDRARGLETGADEFLTKPVTDLAVVSRVRSLARLKMVTDELRMRAVTSREIGIHDPERDAVNEIGRGGHVLIVDDREASYGRIVDTLPSTPLGWRPIPTRRCSMPPRETSERATCRFSGWCVAWRSGSTTI